MERETGFEPALSAWKAEALTIELLPRRVQPLQRWNFNLKLYLGTAPKFSSSRHRCLGGGRWIRTTEGVSQQIYSLPPLAAWVSLQRARNSGVRSSGCQRVFTYNLE